MPAPHLSCKASVKVGLSHNALGFWLLLFTKHAQRNVHQHIILLNRQDFPYFILCFHPFQTELFPLELQAKHSKIWTKHCINCLQCSDWTEGTNKIWNAKCKPDSSLIGWISVWISWLISRPHPSRVEGPLYCGKELIYESNISSN